MADLRRPHRPHAPNRPRRLRRLRRLATAALALTPLLSPVLAPAAASAASAAVLPLAGPAGHLQHESVNGADTVTSTDWAGYAANGSTYTSVSASWVQPAVKCTSVNQYASFWTGLDGYSSASVEQTGSEADCVGGTAEYYAWYEMYPAAPVIYSNTLKAGDKVTASVTFSGTSTYVLTFTDTTQGWSHATTKTASGLARSSAEVIVEAPAGSSGVLPASGFAAIDFTGCRVNGATLGSFDPTKIQSPGLTVSPITDGTNFSVSRS